jgi:2-keto-4-pentenoate hydratase
MNATEITEAARLLVEARRGAAIAGLPEPYHPTSYDDAYAIQDAVADRLGAVVGGWKVGAATETDAAFCAPIYAPMIRPSPAHYGPNELKIIGIEAEIAFRLGTDLPARAAPYQRAEIMAGAQMVPAIEVVDSRYQNLRSIDKLGMLADNFSNGGLVYGAPVAGWEGLDLSLPQITITADGEFFAETTLPQPRDPVAIVLAFAEIMRGRGGAKAGTIVTTGSFTGLVFTKPGTRIIADFGALGRVEALFAGTA